VSNPQRKSSPDTARTSRRDANDTETSAAELDAARPANGWWLIRVFSVIAFGLSAFLLWESLTGNRLPGCGLESGCGVVLRSRWAYWLGVPVSLFALLTYAVVLLATAPGLAAPAARVRPRRGALLLAAAVALIGAALWFVGLQLFVVRAICPFCMAAHACGLLVGALILRRMFASKMHIAPRMAFRSALAGGLFVVVLGAGQVAHAPPTYAVRAMSTGVTTTAANPAGPAATKSPRQLQLHGGAFTVDLNDAPVIGSPDAPHVIVHLFDYTCQFCRSLHPFLLRAARQWSNQLAIVTLPVPLEAGCNRLVKHAMPEHTNACAYARAGLAVWRADHAAFAAFDAWMFSRRVPPPPDEVAAEAMRCVGTNAFRAALADPWINQQLERDIAIYEANHTRYRLSDLPELMIGTNLVAGAFGSAQLLNQFLATQLALAGTNAPAR
jgi:uncharacterized membrane protein